MTDRNQTQPDLLDTFMQSLSSDHPNPPANLAPALASVAVILSAELTPPDPSARFVQGLEQRLTSATPVGSNHSETLPPSGENELAVTQTDAGWQVTETTRRSRLSEFARLAAAVLAIMLIGSTLIFLFSDRDENSSPGILAPSITQSEILVSWDPEGGNNYKLYVIPVDSTEPRKLTPGLHENDGATERFASWSPDGQQIVFVRHEETRVTQDSVGSASDLVIIDADGTNMRTLVEGDVGATLTLPVWSPGGDQIAYVGGTEGPPDIRVINSDGSGHTIIDSLPSSAAYPTWSPDGSQIAVATTRHQLLDLWVMNPDGSDSQALVETEGAVERPVWSPDGRHIAFTDSNQLWIVDADGSSLQSLADETGIMTYPGWSPDGSQLVYATGTFVENRDGIVIVDSDGSEAQRWSTGCQSEASPSYSPDGNRIAYHCTTSPDGDGSWELRIAAPDGSDQRTLLPASVDWAWPPAWNPTSGDDTEPQVDEAPTLQPEPTPADEPTPSVWERIETDVPSAWLSYEGGTQRAELADACGWPGYPEELGCADLAGFIFPRDVMDVPQDTVMTFSIDDMTGDDLINFRAEAFSIEVESIGESRDKPFLEFPITEVHPLQATWSETSMTLDTDLAPGEYVVAVDVSLPSDSDPPVDGRSVTSAGGATYTFHIRVTTDERENPTSFDIDPFTPAFPDAEVVHVVAEIQTETTSYQLTRSADVWIDQTTGDAVAYYKDGDGQLLTINVRQGLTSWEFEATTSHLSVTTVQDPDDPTLPDPAHPLNMFRQVLQHEEDISNVGGEIILDAVYEGQQAIKIVMPLSESGDVYGEVEAYLHPDTLFPMAIIGPGDDELQVYSYPTIETLDRSDVNDELFSPEMPEADSTRLIERLSVDEARAFTDIPIWWLGEEIPGHHLERIDHTLNTSLHGISPVQHVHILYRASPESMDMAFQILSQGPLSEQEEAARSHSRTQATEIEIDGNRGWVWDGTNSAARVEIEYPEGYVTINLTDPDTVDVALEALERLNAD